MANPIVVYTRFNRDDSELPEGWRAKKTLRKTSWWKQRAKVMEQYMLASLRAQTYKGFTLLIGLMEKDRKRAAPVLKLLKTVKEFPVVLHWTKNAPTSPPKTGDQKNFDTHPLGAGAREMLKVIGENKYIVQLHLDSDDMYRKELLAHVASVPLTDHLVLLMQKGFMWHTPEYGTKKQNLAGRLFNYEAPGAPPPFFGLVISREALKKEDEASLEKYLRESGYDGVHHRLEKAKNKRLLPDWQYSYVRHGKNTSSEKSGDPSTWHRYKREITDKREQREVLEKFGVDCNTVQGV